MAKPFESEYGSPKMALIGTLILCAFDCSGQTDVHRRDILQSKRAKILSQIVLGREVSIKPSRIRCQANRTWHKED